ncbi:type I restriction-modification system subunit M N-terminal domain-containing protein [Paracoccus sp. (in: a-proteobacteria)]|uniref:type I restriction-modification system subunit M N-terminal domain-containing protein n=1 Tax=Paracoccus sp. TaxID=267 RepID=UPI002AFE6C5A|nr:type I restriction-modification system subunit M N-terminal domain-containing protein [Paracoccus sp. (in: a-proteobacteria)]
MASIDNGSDLGIEASLFKTADKLRGNMEPSDYKHVALGLIFLKHISDGFELKRRLCWPNIPRMQKTLMLTSLKTSSGFRPTPAGRIPASQRQAARHRQVD